MSVNNLSGKNIVIIGGTAGIGLATAVAASGLGAKVWAAGRSQAVSYTHLTLPTILLV